MDEADLRPARRDRRDPAGRARHDEIDKQEAYSCDVVYGTNSEFGFDYLRDNLAVEMERKAQRGHGFAIVDEVDNILIDEARTPLIISGQPEQAADLYYKFAKLAKIMEPGKKPEGLEAKSKDWQADFDFEPDEKHKTVSVSENGVAKAEKFLGIDNLYRAEYGNLVNHLQQALKAESLYKRGVEYEVIDGEVKIIDEFTGRILEGRRWSEGLHQAVEAKENVAIQEESQTVATITYQNYFRRYDKLAGMTGTALTEATEFMKIYELQVVEIPTNRPMVRADQNDQIYKTKDGKWAAVVNEIKERNATGQPVLVGTISVEVSELLSGQLEQGGHQALGAEREAGARRARGRGDRRGRAPVRGHDRHQHGGPRRGHQARRQRGAPDPARAHEARARAGLGRVEQGLGRAVPEDGGRRCSEDREKVMESGGLFICGTERHESRRIDNQLRGRSGRQGDPGESRFYLSAEDDLVRLFAGDRIYKILDNKFLAQEDEDGQRAADRAQDALEADRGRPEEGRGAELPDPQARPRVRRRDEPAARDHLRVPRPDPRGPGHVRDRPRADRGRDRADRARVHGRRVPGGLGARTRCSRSSTRSTTTPSRSTTSRRARTASRSSRSSARTRSRPTTSARRSSATS